MITEAEIRRTSASLRVDPMIVDLDYVLGCFLASLYRQPAAAVLRFKGGTCLRKCYYSDYRFSEDLDFTLTEHLAAEALERLLRSVLDAADEKWELDFRARPFRVDVVDDEYGKESYQVRLYYHGPLRRGGDPRAIRLDVTTSEALVLPAVERAIIHPYSDASLLSDVRVPCYDLLETLAEKVRALTGQRRHPISRDVYDIDQLTDRHKVDMARLVVVLPAKCEVKGLQYADLDVDRLVERQAEFRADWDRNLVRVLPADSITDFEGAWNRTLTFVRGLNRQWAADRGA